MAESLNNRPPRPAQAERGGGELEALYRADEQLYRHLRLDQVLEALVDVVVDLLHADKASVQVWNAERSGLMVRAARGLSQETVDRISCFGPGDGISGQVYRTGTPVALANACEGPWPAAELAQLEGVSSVMSAPITVNGRIFGVFSMHYCAPRTFGPADLRLSLALAQRAGMAIENARLYEQAEQAATLVERERLARELHDSVTQSLYSLLLLVEATRRFAGNGDLEQVDHLLGRVGQTTRQALKEMRLMVYDLRPLALQNAGLVEALQQRLEAVEKRAGIASELKVDGCLDLPPSVEEELYRIAQEALNNALKHAGASTTTVRVQAERDAVELTIVDDGRGFDPRDEQAMGGMGMTSMRERAARLGATLEVTSAPERGTCVHVRVKVPVMGEGCPAPTEAE